MTGTFDIIERGTGEPLVLIPGIQGRWEYSRGIVEALARNYRVITFSLADERTALRDGASCMDVFADQVAAVLDRLSLPNAHIVGVSFGGLVALRFSATRSDRTRTLALVSAPGPHWHLRQRHDLYARLPWLFGPVFLAEAPLRLSHEVRTALPAWADRRRYLLAQLHTLVTAPVPLARMAARARLIGKYDRIADTTRVTSPTLILQGEDALDHVTGSGGTAEYARLIAGARHVELPRTGHLGSVTRPDDCAAIIHRFIVDSTKDRHHSAA